MKELLRPWSAHSWVAFILGGAAWLGLSERALAARPLGIDVSHWQGTFNWTNAKNANVEFAYCKATQDTNYTDAQFVNNEKGAAKVGIPIGAYHFTQYDTNFGTAGAGSGQSDRCRRLPYPGP